MTLFRVNVANHNLNDKVKISHQICGGVEFFKLLLFIVSFDCMWSENESLSSTQYFVWPLILAINLYRNM
jgi:hypothetical protein